MRCAAAVASAPLALAALVLAAAAAAQDTAAPGDGWKVIEGSMSLTGTRQILPTEGDRPAGVAHLSGSVVLTVGEELRRGFRSEAIYFDDGRGLAVGRSVWTDDRGDRIFAQLRGEPVHTGTRISGTVTGGTGRYAGLAGEFSFVWQYVVAAEPGELQGRTVTLKGRYRPAGASR